MNTEILSNVESSESPGARLRLKRVFLWALVASLTTCAAIAVAALLFARFNETTARILGTLGALAFHSAVAMACAWSLERRRWPALSLTGLAAFGVSFVVLVTCIWVPGLPDDYVPRAMLTTGALLGYYLLAIPGASSRERRRLLPLALTALGACAVGLLMVLICIWVERAENVAFGKATAVAAIIAFSLAHTCLLAHVPAGPSLAWLLKGGMAAAWAFAGLGAAMIVMELDDEFSFRLLGALGVVDACGSLALVILVKVRQVQKIEKLTSAAARIELYCPRCSGRQVVDAGASQCAACGLKLRIEIEEPRCAKCDYLLWQLPERRCPECGTPF
jgi:hypothetical protein